MDLSLIRGEDVDIVGASTKIEDTALDRERGTWETGTNYGSRDDTSRRTGEARLITVP